MSNRNMCRWIIAGLCGQLLSFSASAYTTYSKWPGNNTTMRASAVSFPAANAYRTALGTVASRWNQNPSNFWFTQTYDDPSVSLGNGQNEVWFSSDANLCSPAVTYSWWNGSGNLTETDVCFYVSAGYTTSMSKLSILPYGGASRPFETTAMHEYGHALGLGHEADEYNIMGSDWNHLSLNGATARSYSGEDADDGAVNLYGLWSGGTIEDIGVVHMKRIGASGEYSTHGLTKMYNNVGVELPFANVDGQRRYNVSKGQVVQVEFTYENNGEAYQSPNVGFYISSNSTISTSDSQITTFGLGLGRADVFTYKRTVTVPAWLTSGSSYYLGAYADWNNLLTEVTEVNNAAYHIIRVN
ncbi:MAG: CARDB domain-containing protein [Gammaproteobacteria bacterium]